MGEFNDNDKKSKKFDDFMNTIYGDGDENDSEAEKAEKNARVIKKSEIRKKRIIIASVAVIIIAGIFIFRNINRSSNQSYLERCAAQAYDDKKYKDAQKYYKKLMKIEARPEYAKGFNKAKIAQEEKDQYELGKTAFENREYKRAKEHLMNISEDNKDFYQSARDMINRISEIQKDENRKKQEAENRLQERKVENVQYNTPTYGLNNLRPRSTSRLHNESGFTYLAANAKDNDVNTCWAEGVDGDGIGEIIEYLYSDVDVQIPIKGVKIVNGCCNSREAYYNNNRIKEAKLVFDGYEELVTLEDSYRKPQYIKLKHPVNATCMALEIVSVYPGEKYSDTCLSEFIPY